MAKQPAGDPSKRAFFAVCNAAFSRKRPKDPKSPVRFQFFAHWQKHEIVDNPARMHDVPRKNEHGELVGETIIGADGKPVWRQAYDRKPMKMVRRVPGMGRIALWRHGGTEPEGAEVEQQDDGTWYGFEVVAPHDLTPAGADAALTALFSKFGK